MLHAAHSSFITTAREIRMSTFRFDFGAKRTEGASCTDAGASTGGSPGVGGGSGVAAAPIATPARFHDMVTGPAGMKVEVVADAAGVPIVRKCLAVELPETALTPVVARTDVQRGV